MSTREKKGKVTLQSKLWRMILFVALPPMIAIVAIAYIGISYALKYDAILNNVTAASNFNQNFKDVVDNKMYYFVIDSQYSEGLPKVIEEVQSAEAIASRLLATTTEKNSLRAINSVLNLSQNLKEKMQQIAEDEGLRFPYGSAEQERVYHNRSDPGLHVYLSVLRGGTSERTTVLHGFKHDPLNRCGRGFVLGDAGFPLGQVETAQ